MKKVRIIVIDDDPLSLLIAKKLLKKYLPSDFNYMLEAFQDSKVYPPEQAHLYLATVFTRDSL